MLPSFAAFWVSAMAEGAGIDTDVILKCAAWGLGDELVMTLEHLGDPGVLGVVHLIAERQLRRMKLRNREAAKAHLAVLLGRFAALEPNEDEVALAGELAGVAQRLDLPFDIGEAQLAAISILRPLPLLVTGDKRAIAALPLVLKGSTGMEALASRVACLEQVLQAIAIDMGPAALRERVCTEPAADGALALACSCTNPQWSTNQLDEALSSFIDALRRASNGLLTKGSLFA